MKKNKIKKIIEELISKKLEREDELLGSGILDSMMTMLLVGCLEEEFSITFDPVDFTHHNFNSLDAIEKLVNTYTNNANNGVK